MDSPELPSVLRASIADSSQDVLVSAASIWEMAIKWRRGRLEGVQPYLDDYPALHRRWGFRTLAIEAADACLAGRLPFSHGDPFDRVLIAQSLRLDADLATCDAAIAAVHERTVWH